MNEIRQFLCFLSQQNWGEIDFVYHYIFGRDSVAVVQCWNWCGTFPQHVCDLWFGMRVLDRWHISTTHSWLRYMRVWNRWYISTAHLWLCYMRWCYIEYRWHISTTQLSNRWFPVNSPWCLTLHWHLRGSSKTQSLVRSQVVTSKQPKLGLTQEFSSL